MNFLFRYPYLRTRYIAFFPCCNPPLGHRVLRRYRDHHMHMICHQMPFFDLVLLVLCQTTKHLSKMRPQLAVQHLPSILRHYVVPAVSLAFYLVHPVFPFVCLAPHDWKFLRWTSRPTLMSNFYCHTDKAERLSIGECNTE